MRTRVIFAEEGESQDLRRMREKSAFLWVGRATWCARGNGWGGCLISRLECRLCCAGESLNESMSGEVTAGYWLTDGLDSRVRGWLAEGLPGCLAG